ncbi:MAG: proprotein convertase P-domain-containing protein [Sandaracinaceae bacterium]
MRRTRLGLLVCLALGGCAMEPGADPLSNPFTDPLGGGKEDTAYQNPDGVEVEVDFEADVVAPRSRIFDAPADLGQYAVTYLRHRGEFYLESIAEAATSADRVEWQVDGEWISSEAAHQVPVEQLRHFRIRGLNAVLLHSASRGAELGQRFEVELPIKPYSVMSEAGDTCAEEDGHLGLSASIYWYLWDPDRAGCTLETQMGSLTVSRTFQESGARYPEFDRLTEDGRVTAVVLFGQIDDGEITNREPGVVNLERLARWLVTGGFHEVDDAPVGRRFQKTVNGVELVYDLYGPNEFSGLSDLAHFDNFQRAIAEHEIVAYDGHSMLGASDFWSRPTYPSFYQIYLYGGCLGYEYYLQPILGGKGGWDNVDIVSSVVEVSADANYYAAPVLAQIERAIATGRYPTWADLLVAIRQRVGDSTFGVSGVSDNCFTPTGTRCDDAPPPPPSEVRRFESTDAVAIPDDEPAGATSTLTVSDTGTAGAVEVELDVTHTYVGDLKIVLSHGGVDAVLWDEAGGSADDIHQTVRAAAFDGASLAGEWVLHVSDNAAADVGTLEGWALVVGPAR